MNIGPGWNRKWRWPVPSSSSSNSVPRMSLGIRSGVNCTRRNCSASACPSERTNNVLPSPGTPSSRQCPPASRPISNCSTTASWPTIACAIAPRSVESCASCAFNSDSDTSFMRRRPSAVQCVHHDVDREPGVVLGQEALVAPVVVPLAPVILVAVEHAEAAVDLDAAQVIVHEIVAPPVQLEAGGGRALGEAEETAVQRMVVRQLAQRLGAEDRRHLRFERLREQAVDVVVAVVHEHEAAIA